MIAMAELKEGYGTDISPRQPIVRHASKGTFLRWQAAITFTLPRGLGHQKG